MFELEREFKLRIRRVINDVYRYRYYYFHRYLYDGYYFFVFTVRYSLAVSKLVAILAPQTSIKCIVLQPYRGHLQPTRFPRQQQVGTHRTFARSAGGRANEFHSRPSIISIVSNSSIIKE